MLKKYLAFFALISQNIRLFNIEDLLYVQRGIIK